MASRMPCAVFPVKRVQKPIPVPSEDATNGQHSSPFEPQRRWRIGGGEMKQRRTPGSLTFRCSPAEVESLLPVVGGGKPGRIAELIPLTVGEDCDPDGHQCGWDDQYDDSAAQGVNEART